MKKLAIVICVLALVSCATKKASGPPKPPPIRSIAIVAGDPLSGALGTALFDQNFRTFELPANQDLSPAALRGLATRGVDGVLVVSSKRGLDSHPDSASIRLLRAANGETVATFNWTNPAAPARLNTADSARQLVRSLQEAMPK